MALSVKDIIDFVIKEQEHFQGQELSREEVVDFIGRLQTQIKQMDFSVPEGTTMVAYSGWANDCVRAWEVADKASTIVGDGVTYIGELEGGKLLNNKIFQQELETLIGEDYYKMVFDGCDTLGKRLTGGTCGLDNNILSLVDFVSAEFMSASGASSNIIVITPEGIDPSSVFAATELETILNNDTFKTINGVPKDQLKLLYNSGDVGKQSVYEILQKKNMIHRRFIYGMTGLFFR